MCKLRSYKGDAAWISLPLDNVMLNYAGLLQFDQLIYTVIQHNLEQASRNNFYIFIWRGSSSGSHSTFAAEYSDGDDADNVLSFCVQC